LKTATSILYPEDGGRRIIKTFTVFHKSVRIKTPRGMTLRAQHREDFRSNSNPTFPEGILGGRKQLTPWPWSTSELYLPSDRRLSAKLAPTSADRGCHVVSVTDPYGRILVFYTEQKQLTLINYFMVYSVLSLGIIFSLFS
jgi:hypothetical protein